MPLESLQTDFSNKTYAIWKKIHTFFFLLRSSILKLMYLYNFGYSIYKITSCSSPMKFILNAIGPTWFGFYKTNLCPIFHNDLIVDWFNRENLYGIPRVTTYSFGFEIDKHDTIVHVILATFYRIPIWCSKRELWWFFQGHLFEMKFRSLQKP